MSALDERAGRLLISCLVATGDRVAALDAADKLYGALDEAGLEPELATEQLMVRLRQRG